MCNVRSLGRMFHLATNSAVLLRRCFTPEVHTRTDEHATEFYTSAPLNSASNLCHCKNFGVASLAKLGRCTGCFHWSTLSTFAQVLSFQFYTLHSFAHVSIVQDSTKPAKMATLFGDAVFKMLLNLPPVEQIFLTAITGRYACTRDGTPSSNFGLDRLVLFPCRRLAPKPACDGARIPRHHASQISPASLCSSTGSMNSRA